MTPRAATSYRDAGVDIEAGDRAVELMRAAVGSTARPGVVGGIGGFAGLFALDVARYRRPLLASSADGVGTKLAVARAMGRHDTVGIDLVAMVVDDLVVCGAEPLFLLDYLAVGRVVPERVADIVAGVAAGCVQAGCALVGGETAEHPGELAPDHYDLAGFGLGVVEADAVLGPDRVRAGDAVLALASSGLHSNGYSLARRVLLADAGLPLPGHRDDLGGSLGDALLTPTRIYARDCLTLAEAVDVRAYAHVTGGGLAANLARVVPAGLAAVVERASWTVPPVFGLVARTGGVDATEMECTFNHGVGMLAVVAPEAVQAALRVLADRGVPAWLAGEVLAEPERTGEARGSARLVGRHPS